MIRAGGDRVAVRSIDHVQLAMPADFRPARKAHPALVVDDEPLPGYRRVYVDDPFGNRRELMSRRPSSGGQGRLAGEPGAGGLELGPEAEERGLVAGAGDELDRHRQAARVAEREHHGGLAGQVEPDREG